MKKSNTSIISVSVTDVTRESFRLLDSIRPNYVSFSSLLGIAAGEYYESHKVGNPKITDFVSKDAVASPQFFTSIQLWEKFLKKLPNSEVKNYQKRISQLSRIMNERVEEMLA